MQQILKRLELIRTSIVIDDLEIIQLQIEKLKSLEIDEEVKTIIKKLNNNDFGTVVVDLEKYIQKFSGVVVYEDKEIQGLKLEMKVLEGNLQELSEEKNEYINEINEFNTQYNLRLGEIISKILEKEKELLSKEVSDNPEDENIRQEYEEAQKNYEEFNRNYEEILKEERYELDGEELQELKRLWKKAVKLCHPDIVADHLKDKAQEIIQKLNEAYGKKDIEAVREILYSLENRLSFDVASDTIANKEILRVKIIEIRNKIDEMLHEIEEIKADETFILIQGLDNWDVYFENIYVQLQRQYDNLCHATVYKKIL